MIVKTYIVDYRMKVKLHIILNYNYNDYSISSSASSQDISLNALTTYDIAANPGTTLAYDQNSLVWSTDAFIKTTDIVKDNEVCIKYENVTIDIRKDGIYINDVKETNPSKIGLLMLRYSENLNDDKIDSITDL